MGTGIHHGSEEERVNTLWTTSTKGQTEIPCFWNVKDITYISRQTYTGNQFQRIYPVRPVGKLQKSCMILTRLRYCLKHSWSHSLIILTKSMYGLRKKEIKSTPLIIWHINYRKHLLYSVDGNGVWGWLENDTDGDINKTLYWSVQMYEDVCIFYLPLSDSQRLTPCSNVLSP